MTLLYRHSASHDHDTGAHPENARRISAIEDALERTGWRGLDVREAPRAEREQLERVHTSAHVERIEEVVAAGGGMIDMDTATSAGSLEAALRGAGAACAAVDELAGKGGQTAFCALRPPGHHAERERAMGFCLFNNVAVAAAHAIATGAAERVLVLDWDVHHGNGTEEIFKASSEVLFASIHEYPLYPGTGPAEYTGEGEGEGYTVNLPVPRASGSETFTALVQHVVAPIARRFEPGLIAISAGFDAHRADPLSTCRVDEDGFRQMASSVVGVAVELGVPVIACLEGGYDPGALASSVLATLDGLGSPADDAAIDPTPVQPYLPALTERWDIEPG